MKTIKQNFIKKAESYYDYIFDMNYQKNNNDKKLNCLGFVSELFPFLKDTNHKTLALKLQIKDGVFLEELKEPQNYCFIFSKENSLFFNHISVFLDNFVYEFGVKGYTCTSFSEFKKRVQNSKFFFATDSNKNILNLKENFTIGEKK